LAGSARAYLFSLEQFGIKLGLDQIRALLAALGRPDLAFPSLVIGGTNGKGSMVAMVERGLRAAGYRTGRYTSPHLVSIEERICVDGVPVEAATFDRAAERVREAAAALAQPPTFFEATTALALEVFREAGVNVAVLEVGLGGRLDATNAVTPVAVAIAAVDFDHEAHLGGTLDAIATEKAGILKRGTLALLAPNPAIVRQVVDRIGDREGVTVVHAFDGVDVATLVDHGRVHLTIRTPHGVYRDVVLGLRGRHQVDNAVTAVRLLEELHALGHFRIPEGAMTAALTDVVWPARLEVVAWEGGSLILDGAHNPAAASALAAYLEETCRARVPVVFGVMRDKRADRMIAAIVPVTSHLIATAAASARAMPPAEVAAVVRNVAPMLPVFTADSPAEALARARPLGDPVVVAGSLYLAGEVRAAIGRERSSDETRNG
jgi:dihydrofolate synthase/folylpolyglutamate synthase